MLAQHDRDGAHVAREAVVDHRDEQNVFLLAVMIGIGKPSDERDEARELLFVVRLTLGAQCREPPLHGIESPFDEAVLCHQQLYGFHFRCLSLLVL